MEEWIEEQMDELELEEKTKRSKFKREIRNAWEDTEKQDKK